MAKPKKVAPPIKRVELRSLIAPALVALLAVIAYWPSLGGAFIWDDPDYVVNNPTLRSADGLRQMWFEARSLPQYYPMVHTTYWVEYHLWGLRPSGFKIVNLLLHLGSALLLWIILKRLKVPGAGLAASIWALHPVMVESVAWITERKNTLSALFYLASVLMYLRYLDDTSERRKKLYAAALGLFLLALLSKTVTASLPAAMLLVIWWRAGKVGWADIKPLIPFFVLGATIAPFTAYLERHHVGAAGIDWQLSWTQRLLIAGRAVWFYAAKLVAPSDLSFIYPKWSIDPRDWKQYIYLASALLVVAMLFFLRRKIGRGPLVAALFFGGTLLPALGFFDIYPMRYSYVADHFQYLASIGLIVLVCAAIGRGRWVIAPLLVCALTVLTWRQAHIYRSKLDLWADTTRKNPDSWMAWLNLGHAYVEERDYALSTAHYEHALHLAPNVPETHFNVGYARAVGGKLMEAIEEYKRAIAVDPKFVGAYYNMANAYRELGQDEQAIKAYETAIEKWPEYPEAHFNLATMLEERGDIAGAIGHYKSAVAARPNYAKAHHNVARLLWGQQRRVEAMAHFIAAAEADSQMRPVINQYLSQFGLALPPE